MGLSEKLKSQIPRLGGMHLLMSFIGCCGTVMTNSGLSDFLRSAFGSADKMLSGKNFPQSLRALRMVVEELLHGSFDDMTKFVGLTTFLQTLKEQSPTSTLLIDNVIRHVYYMLLFVRAEREGDWSLH